MLTEDEAVGMEETVGSSISIALDEDEAIRNSLSKSRAAVVGNAADAAESSAASGKQRCPGDEWLFPFLKQFVVFLVNPRQSLIYSLTNHLGAHKNAQR